MKRVITIGIAALLFGLVLSVPLRINALQDEKSVIEEADDLIFMQSMPKIIQEVLKTQVFDETIFILGVFIWCILLFIRDIIHIPIEVYHLLCAVLIRVELRLMTIKQEVK